MPREDPQERLHRVLRRDLPCEVSRTEHGTWQTTSALPHEIRLHREGGTDLVRISAGMVVDVEPRKRVLRELNRLNAERAFSRRIHGDGKVLVTAEMPVASLRRGDVEHLASTVFCLARLDAGQVAQHGGRAVPELVRDRVDTTTPLHGLRDVLRASGTATLRELAVWLDDWAGCDCWIEQDADALVVVLDGTGVGIPYPLVLDELRSAVAALREQALDDDDVG